MTEWFEEWFGEEYLHLYPHRNDTEAGRLIGLLVRTLPWRSGWLVLDAACGAGRHLLALEHAGARPFGFDLSAALLRRAREASRRPLVRADLRAIPFRRASMDLTVNLFTSFGYFADDEQHHDALGEMLATVRPGGWFVMDFLNAEQVRGSLVAEERVGFGSVMAEVHRAISIDQRFVCKTIRLPGGRQFQERVRLLDPADLERMFEAHGATMRYRFGDYDGAALGQGPRTILLTQVPE